MKLYSIVQYRFTDYPYSQNGIQYIDSYKLTEQGFMIFIQNTDIHSISFNSTGRQVNSQLTTIDEFFNGLYMDITNNKHYMICSIAV